MVGATSATPGRPGAAQGEPQEPERQQAAVSNRRAQAADDTGEQRRQSQRPPGRRTTGPPGDVVPRQLAFIYEPETYVPTEEELRRNVQGALPPGVIDVGRDAPPRALPHAAAAARAKPTALPSGEPILVDILDVDLEEFDYGRVPRELLAGRRERRRLSGDALRDALADHVVAQLHRLPRRPQQQARRLMVFKGGGYVYADMFYMLARAGLDHAIGMTNVVAEADCVVAKASWEHNPGRRVNLDQHRAAAANQRIPFVLVNQVTVRDLVLKLWPLLLAKGVLPPAAGSRGSGSGETAPAAAAARRQSKPRDDTEATLIVLKRPQPR